MTRTHFISWKKCISYKLLWKYLVKRVINIMTLHSNPRRFAMEKKTTQQTYHYQIFTKTHFHKDITKENNKMQFNNWKCFEISSFFFLLKMTFTFSICVLGLRLWCLTIFQRKSKDPKKTTDLSQVTDKFYHIMLYTSP